MRRYQADTRDERAVGVVLASGAVRAATGPDDAELVARARELVAEGLGEDLLRLPNRSFPSFVSAATYLDTVDAAPDEADVGSEEDLRVLKDSLEKLAQRPKRVDAVMIQGADHMYTGQEAQVARIVGEWAERL